MRAVAGLGALVDPHGVGGDDPQPAAECLIQFLKRSEAAIVPLDRDHRGAGTEQRPGQSAGTGAHLIDGGAGQLTERAANQSRRLHDRRHNPGVRGPNVVFGFEVDGVHIAHLGDLGHLLSEEQLAELGPVDVLLVPAGGVFVLGPTEAAEVVSQVSPKIVIPMHFAVDGASTDLQPPDKFLQEMAVSEPIRQPKAVVTPSSLPDETQVVLLDPRGRTS